MLRNLWVMRHGLAVDQFDSDFTRELSTVGAQQAHDVSLKIIAGSNEQPRDMLVSPLARTQSTANIVHKNLSLSQPFETEEMLVHSADHKILGDYLLASSFSDLIIVSHMPIVAQLCQYLVDDCEVFGFQTAQVVKIQFSQNSSCHFRGEISNVYLP